MPGPPNQAQEGEGALMPAPEATTTQEPPSVHICMDQDLANEAGSEEVQYVEEAGARRPVSNAGAAHIIETQPLDRQMQDHPVSLADPERKGVETSATPPSPPGIGSRHPRIGRQQPSEIQLQQEAPSDSPQDLSRMCTSRYTGPGPKMRLKQKTKPVEYVLDTPRGNVGEQDERCPKSEGGEEGTVCLSQSECHDLRGEGTDAQPVRRRIKGKTKAPRGILGWQ